MSATLTLPLLAALVVVAAGLGAGGPLAPPRRLPGRPSSIGAVRSASRWHAPIPGLRGTIAAVTRLAWARAGGDAPTDVDLAGWCERVARALRSGDALRTAVRSVPLADGGDREAASDGALARVLAPIHLALDRGATLVEAVAVADGAVGRGARARTSTSAGVAMVRSVLTAVADLGGPGAEALDRTAAVLRQRDADAAEQRVHAAQARLSATVLTVLPVATGALLLVLDAEIRRAVVGPIGSLVLGLGLMLDVLGWWWMRRIVAGGP